MKITYEKEIDSLKFQEGNLSVYIPNDKLIWFLRTLENFKFMDDKLFEASGSFSPIDDETRVKADASKVSELKRYFLEHKTEIQEEVSKTINKVQKTGIEMPKIPFRASYMKFLLEDIRRQNEESSDRFTLNYTPLSFNGDVQLMTSNPSLEDYKRVVKERIIPTINSNPDKVNFFLITQTDNNNPDNQKHSVLLIAKGKELIMLDHSGSASNLEFFSKESPSSFLFPNIEAFEEYIKNEGFTIYYNVNRVQSTDFFNCGTFSLNTLNNLVSRFKEETPDEFMSYLKSFFVVLSGERMYTEGSTKVLTELQDELERTGSNLSEEYVELSKRMFLPPEMMINTQNPNDLDTYDKLSGSIYSSRLSLDRLKDSYLTKKSSLKKGTDTNTKTDFEALSRIDEVRANYLQKVRNRKVAIFDLDETLIDTMEPSLNCLNKILEECEKPSVTFDQFLQAGLHSDWFKEFTTKEDFITHYSERYPELVRDLEEGKTNEVECFRKVYFDYFLEGEYYKQSKLKSENIPEILNSLKSAGYSLIVLTNSRSSNAKEQLKLLGIADKFDMIFGAGDSIDCCGVLPSKPNAEAFDLICRTMKINPRSHSIVMIGDSVNDLRFAKNSGIDCILIPGYSREKIESELSHAKPISSKVSVIESIDELPRVLSLQKGKESR